MKQPMETRASSINRALDQIGDRWSLLLIGEVLWGVNTFSDLLAATGMSRGVLSDRLKWLEEVDCLRKEFNGGNRRRPVYHMTQKSVNLYDTALMALSWERRFFSVPELDSIELLHQDCGKTFKPFLACKHCGEEVEAGHVEYRDGTGAKRDLRKKKTRRKSSKSMKDMKRPQKVYDNLIHLIGDPWTANLIALAYHDIKRFDEFNRELPIATNVLTDRLKFLVREGVFEAVPYMKRPLRVDYFLSEKGLALFPFFQTLLQWGDKWCGDGSGPPVLLTHTVCSHRLVGEVRCDQCNQHVVAYRVSQKVKNNGSGQL
jgi:DNA-binding HxlR family transcriptional regulator